MPPRSGQLDEISQKIGELTGTLGAVEKYIHENNHGVNNLSQKVEALGVRITRDIAAVEGRIEGRIKAMDGRLLLLEQDRQREAGAKNLVTWLLQSPLIGWIAAGIVFFAAWWKGQGR